jgi:phasin family protein
MMSQVQEFVSEQTHQLATQVSKFRKESVENAREAALDSAETIKSLKSPVRTVARQSIKFTNVTQTTMQSLIELQSDVITAALTDAAQRLERASRASNVIELVSDQVGLLPATRSRIAEDATRAVDIFKQAGRDLRTVAKQTVQRVSDELIEDEAATAPKTTRKAKTAGRKKATRKAKKTAGARKTTRAKKAA